MKTHVVGKERSRSFGYGEEVFVFSIGTTHALLHESREAHRIGRIRFIKFVFLSLSISSFHHADFFGLSKG